MIRRRKKMTQEQLAEKSGTHYTFISNIEQGKGNPSLQTINKLSIGLKVPIWEIFLGMESPYAWPTKENFAKLGFLKSPKKRNLT